MVSAIPEGSPTIIPYLVTPDSVKTAAFYSEAFGAEQVMHMPGPGGQGTMHAELRVFGAVVMLTDENPHWGMKSPATLGASQVSLMIYCEDVDAVVGRAVEAGCELKFPVQDQFWGDRMGRVVDPFGYEWAIAQHIEDVPPEEMEARQTKWLAEMAGGGEGSA